jgi:uncharacterized protein YndB with AHSA1/START domain
VSLTVGVTCSAPAGAVWERLADVSRWPEWNPACADARLDGPLAAGSRLRLRLIHPRGREFLTTPIVTQVDPGMTLAWETRALGVRAPTRIALADAPGGTEVVLVSESRGTLGFTYRLTFPETTQGLLWSGALTGLAQSFR